MARRSKKNTYLWYALYAVAGYYAYTKWFAPKPVLQITAQPQTQSQ